MDQFLPIVVVTERSSSFLYTVVHVDDLRIGGDIG